MPRRARIMLSGIPVHIRHRGNNRQRCFYEDRDRSFYLFHLCRLLATSQCVLHAYCLMANHVHLLLKYMMNRTYGRSGSLREGRFRSSLVQSERYLLECYRYVELNPVEAGMVERPGDYAWSSYAANVGAARSALVTPHDEYLRLGRSDEARTQAYRALFDVPLARERMEEIRSATNGNFALGDKPF